MGPSESLLDAATAYLKSVFANTIGALGSDFDASATFGDLGLDSFRVLKLVKALEADFGHLPRTLLYENDTIDALARYFAEKHTSTLPRKVAARAIEGPVEAVAAATSAVVSMPTPCAWAHAIPPAAHAAAPAMPPGPLRLLEADLPKYPALHALVDALFQRHKNECGVARGTRDTAPNLYIGSARLGYFNYCRNVATVLVCAYTGPRAYFAELAEEMHHHCIAQGCVFNLCTDRPVAPIAGVAYSATPFGALQRVHGLKTHTLEGGAMRRLRHQVSKFKAAGMCRTVEYACGSDPATDQGIARLIERWGETQTTVTPLIHRVKAEILGRRLHPQHRIFLTYLNDILQNAMLLTELCGELNGHLMDLAFYPRDMPQSGLAYAIHQIIRTLAAEGRDLLSLGGTYGCRPSPCASADPAVEKVLGQLQVQHIFNDERHFHFKNKFRPENRIIYLCRPVGGGQADDVVDIIMMIADPVQAQTSDAANHNLVEAVATATPSAALLVDAAAGLGRRAGRTVRDGARAEPEHGLRRHQHRGLRAALRLNFTP